MNIVSIICMGVLPLSSANNAPLQAQLKWSSWLAGLNSETQ